MNICRIASWNINSVRLRAGIIERFAHEHAPDIICLQETKAHNDVFPLEQLQQFGYEHIIYHGQKSYNGVAILSKLPLTQVDTIDILGNESARHISALVADTFHLHNFYIPAGGDVPDTELNPKFEEKLRFVDWMHDWSPSVANAPTVAVGDFNIAPHEHDVWSHKQLLKVVSHTPIEVEKLLACQHAGGWIDSARAIIPMDEKVYSWWSYRNRNWRTSNRGRRLDHIWLTQPLKDALRSYHHMPDCRDWDKPSDHVPIMIELALTND